MVGLAGRAEPLRCHVRKGADGVSGAGDRGFVQGSRDAEVDEIGEVPMADEMFDGLTSRCTRPLRCAASSAEAI
jgi:hypothetical protein